MDDSDRSFSDGDELSEELQGLVKPELAPGERLLWAARSGVSSPFHERRPVLVSCLWATGLFIISAGCFMLAFVLMPIPQKDKLGNALAVVGVASGGIGVLVAVHAITTWLQHGTERQRLAARVYAITDRRAIIWCPHGKSGAVKVHTLPRGSIKLDQVYRIQYPDGSGDVILRPPLSADEVLMGAELELPTGFTGITDVRRVEELVRRVLVEPGPQPS